MCYITPIGANWNAGGAWFARAVHCFCVVRDNGLLVQVTHASAGVERGLKSQNTMPVEVMGLLHGHIDTEETGTIIVTDVRPSNARLQHSLRRGCVLLCTSRCSGLDPSVGTTLHLQAFPLPVEGTETSVMSDNVEVMNYMIQVGESLETVRPAEHFMGWYHSHPFDVGSHSNAFLSGTDVFTQLAWQRPEDAAGNPWLALVVSAG